MAEAAWSFPDGNMADLLERRKANSVRDINRMIHGHSSLIQRLALDRELEGHEGCVNALAWNKRGSFLISGSDDLQINIWNYAERKLSCRVDTGHSANIFCTRFIPETGDELVVSGAGDAEVRLFNISQTPIDSAPEPFAIFRCHSRRVKKLTVEPGNPNVVWSAGEDGTLRQHDLREGICCPPAGSPSHECRSILLDLRSGAKKSLSDPPKQLLALKSCDISSSRPHQLLVGGSDAFGRLYDRRMLPSTSSCRTKMQPPLSAAYFCPVHLSERRSSSLHLTHVTFSPNGEEVLMSYSGEHVYLMNVNHGEDSAIRYCPEDVPKRTYAPPVLNDLEAFSLPQPVSSKSVPTRKSFPKRINMQNKLFQIATESLEKDGDFLHGIEACSEVLEDNSRQIDDVLKYEFLCTRAALFLKRNWRSDVAMAIRDCHTARDIDFFSFKAYYYLAEALKQSGNCKNALDYATAALYLSPSNPEVKEQLKSIKERIAAGQSSRENGEVLDSSRVLGRRTLSDVLFLSDAAGDAPQVNVRSEREDSDYDEMELDIVTTSISGDESNDLEGGTFHQSLNLIFQMDAESQRESSHLDHSNGSPSSSCQKDMDYQQDFAIDMKQRYVGHCNLGTDIKQASFLGQRGEFIASGSDDGRWFIWEKRTGRLIKILLGDETVVNCIQCHPFDCTIATSGIDNTIKLWKPHAQMPSIMGGTSLCPETSDVWSVLSRNQKKLMRNQGMLPFEFLERLGMHDLSEGNFQPFECVQS